MMNDNENSKKKKNFSIAKKRRKPNWDDIKPSGPSAPKKTKRSPLGECPICCDELGKNPLASTKCGHVYCLQCLEKALSVNKKCPTCRNTLRGKSAYHPLYLNCTVVDSNETINNVTTNL